ncbi:hypothetical protein [Nostoc foliaceum]|uniref:Uncharacterized protein n=1 Tax=Nostoc foliaceum FACHB-393 TaxID=2692915 RepID=A0ABR8IH14_9NOSO|nr:hypothetical protein [Nostoc foliaceum]MBD2650059.1 hypothetical protein [Nostoc foliaceum FACHB-393]MBD2650111.1 hypothetical protein [Nostoc foliaceum FACHB-393]
MIQNTAILSGDYQKPYKNQHCQASTEMKWLPVAKPRIEIGDLGFGSHGLVVTMNLVVMMINIYLYRGRDYGIRA